MKSEVTFRAQLVIHEHRKLFDYWRELAGPGRIPARRDIDPSAIRSLLPHLCLIDIRTGIEDAVFRLAGTGVRDIYGFEVTGLPLGDLEWGERAGYWASIYRSIVDKVAPMQGVVKGPLARREHVTAFWLRLPLSDDGEHVNKILCHDVPTTASDTSCDEVSAEQVAWVA